VKKDEAFAKKLEADLERYRPPRNTTPGRRRLNIFRDVQDLVGNELSGAIKDALRQSNFLIVVCSPHSRRSEWVGKEIDEFMQTHAKESIIPVLVCGRPNYEVGATEEQEQAFHENLFKHLQEPLAADYRSSTLSSRGDGREKKREARFQILAQLLGTSKENLIKRQRRRTIQLLTVAAGVFFGLSIAIQAVQNANTAKRQLKISRSRELGAYAAEENTRGESHLAVLLAIEASRIAETLTAYKIVAKLVEPFKIVTRHTARINHIAWSPDGSRLLTVSHDQTARIWDTRTGEQLMRLSYSEATPIRRADWNKSGTRFVTAGDDRAARVWNAATGTQIQAFEDYPRDVVQLTWNSKANRLATVSDRQVVIQYTDIGELLQAACKKVKKNMYPIDWQRFFPGEEYRRTCPDLPSPK
jgi:hypothetical protein